MIIRARPKYLDKINVFNKDYNIKENEFYFNSGRAALKFYLNYLSNKLNKKIVIAMQDFNCNVVLDAALEANCEIYLLDIKLGDFSISCDGIKIVADKIDVLLLTHYQGIPNYEYVDIIKFCKKRNIIIIEDLSQTYGSSIDSIKVGTLGDFFISSYAFDKPFSCFKGGKLEVAKENKNEIKRVNYLYNQLEEETDDKAKIDLFILFFLYKYTDDSRYFNGIDNYKLIKFLINCKLPQSIVYRILLLLKYMLISKGINKFFSLFDRRQNINIYKLNKMKINLVKEQELNYNYDFNKIIDVEKVSKQYNIKLINNKNAIIHWNRYSILDDKNLLKKYFKNKNIQVKNFNWPVTLSRVYSDNKNIHIMNKLSNSQYASLNIINIPIWNDIK
jgi:dTDP-4-amino-4,6-dideoxygalactose transaminase